MLDSRQVTSYFENYLSIYQMNNNNTCHGLINGPPENSREHSIVAWQE